ncbi:MAG: hypothetical protein ACKOFL_04345, partial [Actinomycetota bacterium]
ASHPALQKSDSADVSQALTWIDSPEGVLAFRRDPGFILIANTPDESHSLTISGELLLASSSEVLVAGDLFTIPSHTTCWISTQD